MYALFLCGPSGSGKSTYLQNLPEEYLKLSQDELVFREAERQKRTYEEVWPEYISTASELLKQQIQHCNTRRLDFVIDMLNLNQKSRKRQIDLVQANATKIAIYFPAYTPIVLKSRVDKRVENGGHPISLQLIEDQYKRYELPQKSEGFDLVASSSHFLDIIKVMDFK